MQLVVSIPGRDLGVLERLIVYHGLGSGKFQSLEGIWGFWNILTKNIYSEQFEVSIPGRDLGVLERSNLIIS